jgi:hypothetical protein
MTTPLLALALALSPARAGDAVAEADPIASTRDAAALVDGAASRDVEVIDLVICLDTSGSMTSLIDSARGRLWDIVNRLNEVAPHAEVRVGLLTYGSPRGATADQGWVIKQADLSTDLDTVYAQMMALGTSGGDEYVGWVLHRAVTDMAWSPATDAVKMVFVAGNESADQARGTHDFRQVAQAASKRGIVVNALFAGNQAAGVQEHWAEVATSGRGAYAAIDMDTGARQVASPVDARLEELNARLNETYVPWGAEGEAGLARQRAMDDAARGMGLGSLGSRAATKASGAYSNAHWDLLDAVDKGVADLQTGAGLPAELRDLSPAERAAWVEARKAERAAVQAEIQKLAEERARYVEAERRKNRAKGDISFDDAVMEAAEAAVQ